MIVYKYFLKLAYRLKSYALIFLVVFMGLGASQVIGNQQTSGFKDTKYKVVIKDQSNGTSDIINELVALLKEKHKVQVTTSDDLTMKEAIYAADVDGGIWIPSDVSSRIDENKEAVEMEIANSLEGNLLREYVNSYIRYAVVLKKQGNFSKENMEKILSQEANVSVLSKDNVENNKDSRAKWGERYLAYIPFVYLSVFIYVLGTIFSKLENDEVAKRIMIGMKNTNQVTMEKFLGGLTFVFIIIAINLAFVGIVSPSFYASASALKMILLSTAMALSAYALSFLCSVIIGDNTYGYSAASTVVAMGLSFISGIMVPLDYVSPIAVNIAKFFPVYYIVKSSNDTATDFVSYVGNLGMILLFGVLYMALAFSVQHLRTKQFGLSFKKA
jgi:hypothetical protein